MNKTLRDFINGFIIVVCLLLSIFIIYKLIYINSISPNKEQNDDYRVLFVTQNDEFISFQNVKKGDFLIEPAAPEKANTSFLGWYTADSDTLHDMGTLDSYVLTKDTTFFAKYSARIMTVSYYSDYSGQASSLLYTTTYYEDEEVPSYTPPNKEGFIFTGWEELYQGLDSLDKAFVAVYEEHSFSIISISDYSKHLIVRTKSGEVLDMELAHSVPAYSEITIAVNPDKTVISLTVNGESITPGSTIIVSEDIYIDLTINKNSFA